MPGNPLVRFDEGRVGRTARCRSLSYSTDLARDNGPFLTASERHRPICTPFAVPPPMTLHASGPQPLVSFTF